MFRDHADAVFGFVLARCGSRSVAEDVTAEVFCEAARVWAASSGPGIERGWLIDVARKRLIDHWRRSERERRRWERVAHETAVEAQGDRTSTEPDELTVALDLLAPRQRAVLILRYVEGLSVDRVADELALSYQATESLLARARRALRSLTPRNEAHR